MKYDVIVIDGRRRNRCCVSAVVHLTEQGIIIFDDSERDRYAEGINFLISKGFRQVPFVGMAALRLTKHETSIFYRDNNCLGL